MFCFTILSLLCFSLPRDKLVYDATTALWCSSKGISESELVELLQVAILQSPHHHIHVATCKQWHYVTIYQTIFNNGFCDPVS